MSANRTVNILQGLDDVMNPLTVSGILVLNNGVISGLIVPGLNFHTGQLASAGISGQLTSIGVSMPSQFSVANSPLTANGTINVTWANESQNLFLCGSSGGAAAAPNFRYIQPYDLVSGVFQASGPSHSVGAVPDPGGSAGLVRYLREDATWANPGASSSGTINYISFTGSSGISIVSPTVTTSGTVGISLASFVASGPFHSAGGVPDPGSIAGSTRYLREDGIWVGVSSSAGGTVTYANIAGISGIQVQSPAINTSGTINLGLQTFVASGPNHAQGAVPDPGSSAGSTRYLREDATWQTPAGGGGGITYLNITGLSGIVNQTTAITSSGTINLSINPTNLPNILESQVTNLVGDLGNKFSIFGGALSGNLTMTPYTLTAQSGLFSGPVVFGIQSPAFASGLTINPQLANYFKIGTLTNNIRLTVQSGTTALDGEIIRVRFKQDGTGNRLLTLDPSNTQFGSVLTSAVLSSGINQVDYLSLLWDNSSSKWDVVAFAPGFAS